MMATLGLSKVFILDKYFTELQKFWETEKKLQGREEKFLARSKSRRVGRENRENSGHRCFPSPSLPPLNLSALPSSPGDFNERSLGPDRTLLQVQLDT